MHIHAKVRAALAMEVSRCDLLVQVVGAKNIPLRVEIDEEQFTATGGMSPNKKNRRRGGRGRDRDPSAERSGEEDLVGELDDRNAMQPLITGDLLDATKVRERMRARTFVEVRFQENAMATTCMEGGAPLWKQSLSLPFRAPQDDYTPNNLSQVTDQIVFTLFDQIVEDDAENGGFLEVCVCIYKYVCIFM
jgi:hypothetical protein